MLESIWSYSILLCLYHCSFGMLGSIDSNTGSPDLGWDTDQFPMDVKNATMVMKVCFVLLFSTKHSTQHKQKTEIQYVIIGD